MSRVADGSRCTPFDAGVGSAIPASNVTPTIDDEEDMGTGSSRVGVT